MKTLKIFTFCMMGLAAVAITSCGDADEEITSYTLARNLSPINLDTKNVSETTASIVWTESVGATSYTMEVFADDSLTFEGTPEQTKEGITPDQIPVSLTGLQFDTKYSVRVKALTEGKDSRTSTWNGVYFKTSAKQFMKNPKPADIADRSVTITWEVEEGFDVSTVVIGSITHEITAEEKLAGKATVEGLEPETSYTAYLYYNGKQCGNRTFTTIADLNGAVLVHDTDDLKKVLEAAEGDEVFALYGGEYLLNVNDDGQTGAAKVSKSITIKGIYPTDQPIIKGRFELNDGAALSISQVVIDGSLNSTNDQIFNYKTADANYGALDVQNCEITGRADGKGLLYLNVKATVESITFNNCLIHGIECSGGDFIDSRVGLPRQVNLTNSTFYDVAKSRDFIRIDDASGNFSGEAGSVVKVDQCTLYNVGDGAANYRLLYVRFAGNKIAFTNNLVVGTNYKRGFANQKSTDQEPTLQNNHYWNCQNLTSAGTGADAAISWFDENGIIDNPMFADADNADFTLGADVQARKNKAGDPRWRK